MFLKSFYKLIRPQLYNPQLSSIGINVELSQSIRFIHPDNITIGDYVYIGANCYLHGQGGLSINSHSILSDDIAILTSLHRYDNATLIPYDNVDLLRPVSIGRFVWIGMRSFILPGVTLGDGCIVGAASVVTHSFPSGCIIAGNPASVVKQRDMQHFQNCIDNGAFYLKTKNQFNLAKIEQLDPRYIYSK
jgi:acetyltransferase-like isoleucine patch superfamily enzyme